jgi:hypothetical protein
MSTKNPQKRLRLAFIQGFIDSFNGIKSLEKKKHDYTHEEKEQWKLGAQHFRNFCNEEIIRLEEGVDKDPKKMFSHLLILAILQAKKQHLPIAVIREVLEQYAIQVKDDR